jgi:hypothetical protein
MRILITAAPLMYREALALALHENRPNAEVMLGSLRSLDGEIEAFQPHLIVGNDTDGDIPKLESVVCRIEILFTDGLDAKVSLDGEVRHIKNIGIDDLLALVDETEALIGKQPPE